MREATTAANPIPTRKSAGSWKRSERNNGAALRGGRRRSRGLVADPPYRQDRRRVAELLAQLPDVDVDRARVARERVPPHALEKLVARQHEAAMVEQLPEEIELLR